MKTSLQNCTRQTCARDERGVSLIELLVAMTIGAVLIYGASKMFIDSRSSYETNESIARLQESARYALSVMEPDIRMSNNWGLLKGAAGITGQSLQSAAANALGGNSNFCGTNYALDLQTNIEGSNNSFVLGVARDTAKCGPFNTAVAAADTLTIRRASINPTTSGSLLVCSTRVSGKLVNSVPGCPTLAAGVGSGNDLLVHAYYLDTASSVGTSVPSLRRKTLITGPAFQDDEIIQGVEDMQIQFGVDDGFTGVATRYVNPAVAAAAPTGQIVSVRIWLLIRAEKPEVGFVDDKTYVYGDRNTGTTADLNLASDAGKMFKPTISAGTALTDVKHYRRLLVSRTIQIRNALGT